MELAAAHDVRARALPREKLQDREIAVGLDRVRNEPVHAREGAVQLTVPLDDAAPAVNVEWRAVRRDQLLGRHALAVQLAVPVAEVRCLLPQ